ncbi:MAG: hypothetical protein EOM59_11230 [Clostridia bacterium]|nr:hypothetical protein [Clostridia bacterium]
MFQDKSKAMEKNSRSFTTGCDTVGNQNNGFTDDGSFVTTEYQYDENGNMIQDLNKTLLLTRYNHLNLPQQIIIFEEFGNSILYLYDAAGRKLRKATRRDYNPTHTTDYVGSFVYMDDELQYLITSEGRVVIDGSNYEYQYFLKDHLGNTRVTFNSGGIIQEDSYYPYGMTMSGLSEASGIDLPNKFLYNGKELQDDFGLNWYDYGARFYDAQLGRWHSIDPMAEDYFGLSPYNYVANNPLKFIDPNGMWIDDYGLDKDGKIALLRETDDKTDKLIALDNKGQETDKSVEVEKGVLNNVKTDKDSEEISYDYMKVGNNETATKLFEFVAENSQVEWSQVKYGTKSNYISTSHNPASEAGGPDLTYNLLTTGYTVRENIHSHPNRKTNHYGPSGFHARDMNSGDRKFAEWIHNYYPSKGVKLKVYEVALKKYIQYNHKAIIK